MAVKDESVSFDFWGIYDAIEEYALISYTLGDERTVRVTFEDHGNHIVVTEVFDAEQVHSEELQKWDGKQFWTLSKHIVNHIDHYSVMMILPNDGAMNVSPFTSIL